MKTEPESPNIHRHGQNLGRRTFLTGAALAGAGLTFARAGHDFLAHADENEKMKQAVSEHARATTLPPDAATLPRWVPEPPSKPYDLNDPFDNHFAWAKVQANLSGQDSWLCQYGWILACPPGKPAYPLLGRVQFVKVFLAATDPAWVPDLDDHSYTMWGTMTTVHVDPRTFEPVTKIENPYTGKVIDVPDILYADRLAYRLGKSLLVPGVDPVFYDQPWDRDGGYSQHFISTGEKVSYTVMGSAQHDGPHQPRLDVGFWTVNRKELIDPNKPSIVTNRDYSAIMKMSEYAWYGAEQGDPAQIKVHLTGTKSQNLADLPDFVKPLILDRFPGRYT